MEQTTHPRVPARAGAALDQRWAARVCQAGAGIEKLHGKRHVWQDIDLSPNGENPLADIEGELFDIRVEFELQAALPDLAYFPGQPRRPHRGRRLLRLLREADTSPDPCSEILLPDAHDQLMRLPTGQVLGQRDREGLVPHVAGRVLLFADLDAVQEHVGVAVHSAKA